MLALPLIGDLVVLLPDLDYDPLFFELFDLKAWCVRRPSYYIFYIKFLTDLEVLESIGEKDL